jgi:hypothetical protein
LNESNSWSTIKWAEERIYVQYTPGTSGNQLPRSGHISEINSGTN